MSTEQTTTKHFLNARELADTLGVHEVTIRRWSSTGRIPTLRAGNRLRFDLDQVLASFNGKGGSDG